MCSSTEYQMFLSFFGVFHNPSSQFKASYSMTYTQGLAPLIGDGFHTWIRAQMANGGAGIGEAF